MASIYVIRHGQASFGTDDYDRLSELGCRQAEVLGSYLSTCGIRFDAVYSGELQRQRRTAEIATAGQYDAAQIIVDPRFNEVRNEEQLNAFTDLVLQQHPELRENAEHVFTSSKDYQKVLEQVFRHWVSLGADSPPGVQSWAEYSNGVRDAVSELMDAQGGGKTIAVFTSGGTIATLVAAVLGLDGAGTYQLYEPVINCSVTRLFYNSRKKVSLSYYNDHSYLDLLGHQLGESLVTYR